MKRAAWLLAIILVVNLIFVNAMQPVFAATPDGYTVRIGLVSQYGEKNSITIKNSTIKMGYEVNGNFVENTTLISTNGFTFTPNNSYCYGSETIYSSYAEAKNVINSLKADTQYVLVAVQGNGSFRVYISSDSAMTAASIASTLEKNGKVKFAAVANEAKYRMKMSWSEGAMIIDVDSSNLYPQFAAATANEAGVYVVDMGERQYRDRIEIGRYEGASGLTAISVVDMEDYLYGVIACEMISTWEMEALKAQAVCARSYAYALDKRNTGFGADNGYALYDTTKSQVYKGYGAETERTNNAVDATKGLMIYYLDYVVKAYFYSTSGGHTANCEDVWNVPLTYFRAVADNTELHQEKAPWVIAKTKADIAADLEDSNDGVGAVGNLIAQIRTTSGRIYQMKINGSSGSTILMKEEISSAFGLPSTKVKLIEYGDIPDKVYVQSDNKNVEKQISSSYIISGDGNVSVASAEQEQYIVISDDNLTNFPRTAPTDSNTIYFAGMGYGHGVGLSQSGAQSLALQGYDYEYIIRHYYSKVDIR